MAIDSKDTVWRKNRPHFTSMRNIGKRTRYEEV